MEQLAKPPEVMWTIQFSRILHSMIFSAYTGMLQTQVNRRILWSRLKMDTNSTPIRYKTFVEDHEVEDCEIKEARSEDSGRSEHLYVFASRNRHWH